MNWFLYWSEMIGTIAFAISGAQVAIQRRLDLFGILLMGIVTALGGGTIRDLILGIHPPRMFTNLEYVGVAIMAALVIFFTAKLGYWSCDGFSGIADFFFVFCDALGLGIFSVIGAQAGIQAGFSSNMFLCVFLGMTTGVGGGILRDIMCDNIPFVLRKHVYAVASIAGASLFCIFLRAGMDETLSTLAGMAITLSLRLLAWKFRWNLPRAN